MKDLIEKNTFQTIEHEGVTYVFFDDENKELKKEYQIFYKDHIYYVMMNKDYFNAMFYDGLELDLVLYQIRNSNSKWWGFQEVFQVGSLLFVVGLALPLYIGYLFSKNAPFFIQIIVIGVLTILFYGSLLGHLFQRMKHLEIADPYKGRLFQYVKNKEFQQRRMAYYGTAPRKAYFHMSLTKKVSPKASARNIIVAATLFLVVLSAPFVYVTLDNDWSIKTLSQFIQSFSEDYHVIDIDYHGYELKNEVYQIDSDGFNYHSIEPCGDYLCSDSLGSEFVAINDQFEEVVTFHSDSNVEYLVVATSGNYVYYEQRYKNSEGECDYVVYTVMDLETTTNVVEMLKEDLNIPNLEVVTFMDIAVSDNAFVLSGAYRETGFESQPFILLIQEDEFTMIPLETKIWFDIVVIGDTVYGKTYEDEEQQRVVSMNLLSHAIEVVYSTNPSDNTEYLSLYKKEDTLYIVETKLMEEKMYTFVNNEATLIYDTVELFHHSRYDEELYNIAGLYTYSLRVKDVDGTLLSEGIKTSSELSGLVVENAFVWKNDLYVFAEDTLYRGEAIVPIYTFDSNVYGLGYNLLLGSSLVAIVGVKQVQIRKMNKLIVLKEHL